MSSKYECKRSRRLQQWLLQRKLVGIVASLSILSTAVYADEFDERVSRLTFGLSAEAVLAVMAREPDSSRNTTFLAIPTAEWRWSASSGRSVAVTMVHSRVITVSQCAGVPTQQC